MPKAWVSPTYHTYAQTFDKKIMSVYPFDSVRILVEMLHSSRFSEYASKLEISDPPKGEGLLGQIYTFEEVEVRITNHN